MSKTILAQVEGWTPVIDSVVQDVGPTTALVFGKAWRYCQMSDGVCKASQDRIADELGMSRQTINAHFAKLVEAEYLRDLTPNLAGLPHQYADTGKAGLSIFLTATSQKILQPPVKNFDTKILSKKQTRNDEPDASLAEISKVYQSEIGLITPMIADELREASTAYPLQWILDAIRESARQNKRGWKYILAILTRWKAQGNQEAMKRPQQGKASNYKPRDLIQERYGGIMEWAQEMQNNDNLSRDDGNNGEIGGGVPQLEA